MWIRKRATSSRGFWWTLSRNKGVTIFVSTHFMNEAMRCDRISLMHAGRVLVCDTPTRVIEVEGARDLEDAFVSCIEEAESQAAGSAASAPAPVVPLTASAAAGSDQTRHLPPFMPIRRLLAYTRCETRAPFYATRCVWPLLFLALS